ncbi:MAG: Rieske 2Fe-2S domain-containing protein, partial [Alicyclobacillus sp.]|nr:Rieske 2Fe-2S domain-containing protein [Alicyclobacillus sp.]
MEQTVTKADWSWPAEGVTRVPYRVFQDIEVYNREQERIFRGPVWNFVGLDVELPNPGDFKANYIGDTPILVTRAADGELYAFVNRCAHRGVKVVNESCGNTGKFFRCPYHAWTYRTDGTLLSVPLRKGYDPSVLESCEAARGMPSVGAVHVYRDFVFCRLNPQ